LIFNCTLEDLKRLQSSEPLHAKMNPTSCLWITACIESCLTGVLLFDEKICQSAALFWFCLRDVGTLYAQAVIQRINDVSPSFLEHGSAEKIAV
jgi:hypothetical protein